MSDKPRAWLDKTLQGAGLKDDGTSMNNKTAARIFIFYLQRDAEDDEDSTKLEWSKWTNDFSREIARAKVVHAFVHYHPAFVVLLPFNKFIKKYVYGESTPKVMQLLTELMASTILASHIWFISCSFGLYLWLV